MAPSRVPSLATLQPLGPVEDYSSRLRDLQLRLLQAQTRLRDTQEFPVVAVFEGMDAAGKGGAIRRFTGRLDPRGYRVFPIGAPTPEEGRHHWLWRFSCRMPERGTFAVFDRSWYGRVLVERVEGLAMVEEWNQAYDEIVAFERQHAESGTVLVKFWMHVSKKEQLRRFRARADDPFKEYKITEEDWRNRRRWADYESAADEMLRRTHRPFAPWTVVHGDDKQTARLRVLEEVVSRLEARMPDIAPPKPRQERVKGRRSKQ